MTDKWRQKLHLEPPRGWLNDPNGLSFFDGKYHVYFQYTPTDAAGGGDRGWGHYESADLLSWHCTGCVINPDSPDDKDGAFSGSGIVLDGKLHLFYTGNVMEEGEHDYTSSGRGANVIHITTADGHVMSEKKTVLRNSDYPPFCCCHVRDPKVWRDDNSSKLRMVLGARTRDDKGCVLLYSCGLDNLDEWRYDGVLSVPDFGYMWECPDLFSLDGDNYLSISPQGLTHERLRYQNVFSSGFFRLSGNSLSDFREWDFGFDFYAPQTFLAPDDRRILIGWMGIGDIEYTNPTTELGWQHCLTLPREITRAKDGSLCQLPIRELDTLRTAETVLADGEAATLHLPLDLTATVTGTFTLTLGGAVMRYDGELFSLSFEGNVGYGRTIRRAAVPDCRDIRVIADTSSLEIYLDGGKTVLSSRFYPEGEAVGLTARCITAKVYEMRGMEVDLGE